MACGTTSNCGDWEGIPFFKIRCIVLSRIFIVTKKYFPLLWHFITCNRVILNPDNFGFDRSNSTGWLKDNINDGRLDSVYLMLVKKGMVNFGYYF